MSQGWFKLHRELFEKAIWQSSTPEQKVILIALLGMANHQGKEWEWKGKQFKAEPGQFVTSIDSIVKRCGKGISEQNVRTALKKFKKYEFLTEEVTKTGRLVTIVNWGLYQGVENETNKQINKDLTDASQTPNKDLTDSSQTPNKQLTPNKNDKNYKNVNNDKNEKNEKNDNKNKYMSDSNEYRLAEYLYKHIKANNPNAKEPNFQNWAKTFDYILRIDKRDLEEVKELIVFCQKHSFWYKNILSADKFRKQYERLLLEKNDSKKVKYENKVYGNKMDEFNNHPQRNYDFDELEKKLLGWDQEDTQK